MNKAELKTAMDATNKWLEVGTPVLTPTSRLTGFRTSTKQYEVPTLRLENGAIVHKVFLLWSFKDESSDEVVHFADQNPLNTSLTTFKKDVVVYMNGLADVVWSFVDIDLPNEVVTVKMFTKSTTDEATHIVETRARVYKVANALVHRLIE